MVQLEKGLPCKYKDMSLNAQHPHGEPHMSNSSTGAGGVGRGQRQTDTRCSLSCKSGQPVSRSKYKMGSYNGGYQAPTSGLQTHTHAYTHMSGMVVTTFNSSSGKVKTHRSLGLPGQASLLGEFKSSERPCLKNRGGW